MLSGLLFLGIFVVLNPRFHYKIFLAPEFFTLLCKDDVGVALVLLFSNSTRGFIERCKYYAPWILTEVWMALLQVPACS